VPAEHPGELALPARAALVVERIADDLQVGGSHPINLHAPFVGGLRMALRRNRRILLSQQWLSA